MPRLALRSYSKVLPPLPTRPDASSYDFTVAHDSHVMTVSVPAAGDRIEGVWWREVSGDLAAALEGHARIPELGGVLGDEIRVLYGPLGRAVWRLFQLLKQELNKYENRTLYVGGNEWSSDGEKWSELDDAEYEAVCWSHSVPALGPREQAHLQELLDRGEYALTATDYMHEARRGSGTRFGWIQTTIAAELAIKEILLRIEPAFQPLLLELPSPPVRKLYGSVLESVAGERSPHLKALERGAELRNRLVHRPDSPSPGGKEFSEYWHTVEQAIEHLLRLARR